MSKKSNFVDWIKDRKKSIATSKSIHVVIGNESCDLDSIVSSLVFAYYLDQVRGMGNVYPLINSRHRHQVDLRAEIEYGLKKGGDLSTNDLIFLSDLPDCLMAIKGISLTDHNLSNFPDKIPIHWIIDHHDSKNCSSSIESPIIESVASTCTLIGEMIIGECEGNMNDFCLITLLLVAISFDTAGLSTTFGTTTEKDLLVVNLLLKKLANLNNENPPSSANYTRLIMKEINDARNRTPLSIEDLLPFDYKEFAFCQKRKYGISSLPVDISSFMHSNLLLSRLIERSVEFLREKSLEFLILYSLTTVSMPISEDTEDKARIDECYRREMSFILRPSQLYLLNFLEEETAIVGEQLMHPISYLNGQFFFYLFNVKDTKCNRKILQPKIDKFLQIHMQKNNFH